MVVQNHFHEISKKFNVHNASPGVVFFLIREICANMLIHIYIFLLAQTVYIEIMLQQKISSPIFFAFSPRFGCFQAQTTYTIFVVWMSVSLFSVVRCLLFQTASQPQP